MYDVNTHIVHDFAITKSFSERDRALEHIEKLEENDILIMDIPLANKFALYLAINYFSK